MNNLQEIDILIVITTIIVLILCFTVVIFFLYFQKKKIAFILSERETIQRFEEEITKSKMEIQEQALQNISWEIHDNVGQLLSVAKMQLNMIQYTLPEEQQAGIQETGDIIGKSLQDLRGLAKSLNSESIKNNGLIDSLMLEIERYNRLKVIEASINIVNDQYHLSNEKEIILFRILQEFCNNSLKYSQAKNLNITVTFNFDKLEITAEDNGIGFDVNDIENHTGIGLLNMKSRGNLIGAQIDLVSSIDEGTKLYISCPK
jgi:two-component system NarL family sensor kinase